MGSYPVIWALTGARKGDNAQALALARAVARETGGQAVEKRLYYNALRALPNILLKPGLAVLTAQGRATLGPPWPDLVIGVGRRGVPVARWIKAQSHDRARLVALGRPRAPLAWFDLVLTSAQYGLPEAPNVMTLQLPPASPPAAPDDLARWREKFSALPRPWTAVLVGGARWPVLFDAQIARRLGEAVEHERALTGGSWIVSTSPRTGQRQARALHEVLRKPGYFYYWRENMKPADNPHRALLALADRFVVTSESASMIAEALRTGKPVSLFPMPQSRFAPHWRARRGLMRVLASAGILTPPRDMRAFCRHLAQQGALRFTTDPPRELPSWREETLSEAIARIAAWFRPREHG